MAGLDVNLKVLQIQAAQRNPQKEMLFFSQRFIEASHIVNCVINHSNSEAEFLSTIQLRS